MKTCAMEGCHCTVESGKQFCSTECENNVHAAGGGCGCKHPDCQHRAG
jgi:hypothetical protein